MAILKVQTTKNVFLTSPMTGIIHSSTMCSIVDRLFKGLAHIRRLVRRMRLIKLMVGKTLTKQCAQQRAVLNNQCLWYARKFSMGRIK